MSNSFHSSQKYQTKINDNEVIALLLCIKGIIRWNGGAPRDINYDLHKYPFQVLLFGPTEASSRALLSLFTMPAEITNASPKAKKNSSHAKKPLCKVMP